MTEGNITIKNARVNNLKGISVDIPRNKLVVITGLSGSGKSSLAFDTLYAEGQRRYVESLSSYARQFLGRMKKPEVDYIRGIPPAIAIEQRVNTRNPRSTVGTSTEIYDYLKLLFARIGRTFSPVSGAEIKKHEPEDVVRRATALPHGTRIAVLTDIVPREEQTFAEKLHALMLEGFSRVEYEDNILQIQEILDNKTIDINKKNKAQLFVDRLVMDNSKETITRLTDSVETAFSEGNGTCVLKIMPQNEGESSEKINFSRRFEADGIRFETPTEHLFSFNNPLGACPLCEGFGRVIGIDEDLVVPNKSLSVYQDCVVCWRGETMSEWKNALIYAADKFGFPIHKPYFELSDAQRELLWTGNKYFKGINDFFKFIESNQYKIQYRVMLARYRGKTTCPQCKGSRLRTEAQYVKVAGKSITELVLMPIKKLKIFFETIDLPPHDRDIAKRLLVEINNRIQFLTDVGLGYLTLNRLSNTLSGGESQRINLATSLGSSLVGSLYILDEPSIGLHDRDTHLLIKVLLQLRDLGNTVVVVEHDEEIIRAADHIIDIGPEAGRHGGEVVFQGEPPKSPNIYSAKAEGDFLPTAKDKQQFNYQTGDPMLYERLKILALEKRKNPTPAEKALWLLLSNKKLDDYKFRRQHIIGDFIVDFVNIEAKLVVEVDGKYHEDPETVEHDKARTKWLESKGFQVIRFTNDEVLYKTDEVLQKISETVKGKKSSLGNLGSYTEDQVLHKTDEISETVEGKKSPLGDLGGFTEDQVLHKTDEISKTVEGKKSPLGDLGGFTLKYLLGIEQIPIPTRRKWSDYIEIAGARENNLKNISVKFPLNVMTVVTGVSGSGKSSLVSKILFPALKKHYGETAETVGKFDALRGSMHLAKDIEFVDQNPIGRSTRSNPVTYIKAYEEIRKLFADQQLAKQLGYTPAFFSFNTSGGRCEECQGEGTVTVEMQFMADITLECEHCHGKRFKSDVLEVKYKNANIYDVLEMTVNQAVEFFSQQNGTAEKRIAKRLKPLQDVGVGYLKLGQSSSTLSGGESQRVKLASFLANEKPEPTIFVFDEPTTGLHFHDIKTLLSALNALISKGHTVIIIEHNPEIIKSADHVIDLGVEGGDEGGQIVFEGTPEGLVQCPNSYTGQFLKSKLQDN